MSFRLAWATDIHLDHCSADIIEDFCLEIQASAAQALCLTGDLAEAVNVVDYLTTLSERIARPIYFVLGNHDYYHGSIAQVRQTMTTLTQVSPWLRWLPAHGLQPLTATSCLIGHDGWSDGRCGNYATSTIRLKDYRLIEEIAQAGEQGRLALLQRLGDEAANTLRPYLQQALVQYQHIFVLMHPPPFREACLYGQSIADDNWAPHFVCEAVGALLREQVAKHPTVQVTVLAGHTHNACDIRILPNLQVKVGAAEYGAPTLADEFEVD